MPIYKPEEAPGAERALPLPGPAVEPPVSPGLIPPACTLNLKPSTLKADALQDSLRVPPKIKGSGFMVGETLPAPLKINDRPPDVAGLTATLSTPDEMEPAPGPPPAPCPTPQTAPVSPPQMMRPGGAEPASLARGVGTPSTPNPEPLPWNFTRIRGLHRKGERNPEISNP